MRDNKVRMITEIGMAVALSVILNFLPLWKMPQGGSVSLEMLPVLIVALRWGTVPGMIAGMVYGFLQLVVGDAYVVHPLQLILDYPLAYLLLGLAGLIPQKKVGRTGYLSLLGAVLLGGLARFISHLISGVVFFGQYAPEGQNVWVYSAIYNGSFILPSILVSFLVIIPLYRRIILENK